MYRKPILSKLLFLLVLFLGASYALVMAIQANAAVTTSQMSMTQLPANHQIECLPTAYSLEDLIDCVTSYMPAKGSEAYVAPSTDVQDHWQLVVEDMVGMTSINDCSTISLPSSLANIYAVFPFTDSYTGQEFCVAMEVVDDDEISGVVDHGWGTLIVNPEPQRYLSIDIPHPIEDDDTNQEGIQIFKGIEAHTFLMAGANREANSDPSPCEGQDNELLSDVAHCTDNLFHPAVIAIDEFYGNTTDHTAIQFHGMGTNTGCPDVNVYITHGSADSPQTTDSIVTLRDELRDLQPSWAVAVPGEDSPLVCGKNGTKNVQGRYLNGLDESEVCDEEVDPVGYSGKFIHIEQHPDGDLTGFRSPAIWIEALKNTFPPLTAPPSTTAISFQDGVSPDVNYFGTTDNWIVAADADDNAGTAAVCGMEGGTDPNDWHATLLRWNISSLPAGSTIHAAEVTLNITDAGNSTGHYAYGLNPDWTELGATWLNYSAGISNTWEISGALGTSDHSIAPIGQPIANSTGVYTFTINPVYVQSWFDTPAGNNGILITNPDNGNDVHFNCSETSTAVNRPKLTIHYSESGGGTVTPTPTPTITTTPTVTPTPTNTPTPSPTPSVFTFQNGIASYNGMTDTWIDEDDPTDNYGSDPSCETDSDEKAALLRWDISSLPTGSTIAAAEVTLRITSATDDPPGYFAYPLNKAWAELEADWVQYSEGNVWKMAGAQSVPEDHAAVSIGYAAPESTGFYTFALDADEVQDWFDNPGSNNGFILVNLNNSDGMDFYCSETSTISYRPKLTIYTE